MYPNDTLLDHPTHHKLSKIILPAPSFSRGFVDHSLRLADPLREPLPRLSPSNLMSTSDSNADGDVEKPGNRWQVQKSSWKLVHGPWQPMAISRVVRISGSSVCREHHRTDQREWLCPKPGNALCKIIKIAGIKMGVHSPQKGTQ